MLGWVQNRMRGLLAHREDLDGEFMEVVEEARPKRLWTIRGVRGRSVRGWHGGRNALCRSELAHRDPVCEIAAHEFIARADHDHWPVGRVGAVAQEVDRGCVTLRGGWVLQRSVRKGIVQTERMDGRLRALGAVLHEVFSSPLVCRDLSRKCQTHCGLIGPEHAFPPRRRTFSLDGRARSSLERTGSASGCTQRRDRSNSSVWAGVVAITLHGAVVFGGCSGLAAEFVRSMFVQTGADRKSMARASRKCLRDRALGRALPLGLRSACLVVSTPWRTHRTI